MKSFILAGFSGSVAEGYANKKSHVSFVVEKAPIDNCAVTLVETSFIGDGTEKRPVVTVVDGRISLTEGTDYIIVYRNNTAPGTATAIVIGTGSYSGSVSHDFSIISRSSVDNADVTLDKDTFLYDGTEKRPKVTVVLDGRTLNSGTDYEVTYRSNTAPGTAYAIVTGIGSYTGSVTVSFTITSDTLADADIVLENDRFIYDGSQKRPAVTVVYRGTELTEGTDYTVSYKNNIRVGTGYITVTGTGKYSGSQQKSFTISPQDIASAAVTLEETSFNYTGYQITPAVTVSFGSKQLTEGTDYTVTYRDNTEVGTASAIVEGKGNFTGKVTRTFTIISSDISSATLILSSDGLVYDGTEKRPLIAVKDKSFILTEGADYTVSYSSNINAGTARVTVTGKGSYSGSVSKSFTISPRNIAYASVSLSSYSYVYDGSAKKPSVSVYDDETGSLYSGTDYTVSYSNNTAVGTASVKVSGKGNYTGSVTKTFSIVKPAETDVAKCTVSNISNQRYTGSAIKPSVTVKLGSTTLTSGTDYTVSYKNNTKPGRATVTVTGKGKYTGSVSRNFIIVPKLNAMTLTTGLTGSDDGFSVKWNSDSLATGYQVQYCKDSSFSRDCHSTTKDKYTDTSVNVVKIPTVGETWYVRMRSYIVIDGTRYGDYCTAKSVTVKGKLRSVSIPKSTYDYTGSEIKPTVTVKDQAGNTLRSTDYTVKYSNNKNVGTAEITITGKGNYTGTLTKAFTIRSVSSNNKFVWGKDNWNFTNSYQDFCKSYYDIYLNPRK